MTSEQFAEWLKDFSSRFPDLGAWLSSKPQTLRVWFSDCFEALEYTDCRAVNMLLMQSGLLNEPWSREKIPAVYLKKCSEIRYERSRRVADKNLAIESSGRQNARDGQLGALMTRSTWECVRQVMRLPHDMRRAYIDQYFDSSDPVMMAEEFVDDPSVLITPARDSLFAEVPTDDGPPAWSGHFERIEG